MNKGVFPDELKHGGIKQIYKKETVRICLLAMI